MGWPRDRPFVARIPAFLPPIFTAGPPLPPSPPEPPGPPPGPPAPLPSIFSLTGLTVTPFANTIYDFNLAITVTQTAPDGSDFQEDNSSTEFHAFQSTIYVYLNDFTTGQQYGPFPASLDPSSDGTGLCQRRRPR